MSDPYQPRTVPLGPPAAPVPPVAYTPPPVAPPKRRRAGLIVGLSLAGFALIAAGVVAFIALRPSGFTAAGGVTLSEVQDKTCAGTYAEIGQGVQVTVTDETGKLVGAGMLGAGAPTADPKTVPFGGTQVLVGDTICRFPFQISDLPAGHRLYGVTIGRHGTVQYTEAEMRRGIELTLNN